MKGSLIVWSLLKAKVELEDVEISALTQVGAGLPVVESSKMEKQPFILLQADGMCKANFGYTLVSWAHVINCLTMYAFGPFPSKSHPRLIKVSLAASDREPGVGQMTVF